MTQIHHVPATLSHSRAPRFTVVHEERVSFPEHSMMLCPKFFWLKCVRFSHISEKSSNHQARTLKLPLNLLELIIWIGQIRLQ